jgi:hypothetical protein
MHLLRFLRGCVLRRPRAGLMRGGTVSPASGRPNNRKFGILRETGENRGIGVENDRMGKNGAGSAVRFAPGLPQLGQSRRGSADGMAQSQKRSQELCDLAWAFLLREQGQDLEPTDATRGGGLQNGPNPIAKKGDA